MDWLSGNTIVILSLICLLAGFIDAIAGGGGLLTIPAFLWAGMPPHLALGTNKLAASFGSFTATVTYYRKNYLNLKQWRHMVISTASGATIGTLMAHITSEGILLKIMPLIILSMAIMRLFSRKTINSQSVNTSPATWKSIIHGHGVGFYDGFAGPGTGSIWTMTLQSFYKLPIIQAIATTKLMNFTSNFVSLVTFAFLGHVHFLSGILFGLSIMIGSWLGVHTTTKLSTFWINSFFTAIVVLMSVKLIFDTYII